ncbi:SPOR domain-containing protein [Halobacillus litoralis]|uniref:SPOR domain-containing protein n=1 Tax=Halobacillus litoralis TaxID=45668 RepID=UPI001CFC841F|nr:SPOR domain-containing protein [Halobacillus litoralis]
MDSKKKISISFRNEQEPKREVVRTQSEQAAVVEEDKEERPVTPVYQLPFKKAKRISGFKPLLTTAVTALIISLGLGFVLLRMFVSLTEQTSSANDTLPVIQTQQAADSSDEQTAEAPLASGPNQVFDTYIVQAGAFSTEGKAKEWQSRLTAQSIPSVVWNRDGQYFLFVGSSSSKQEAEYIAEQMKAQSIETYVKPWVVNVDKQVPVVLQENLKGDSLGSVTEADREKIVAEIGKDNELGQALATWESQDDTNINWLKVTKALE